MAVFGAALSLILGLLIAPAARAQECSTDRNGPNPTGEILHPVDGEVLEADPGDVAFAGTAESPACVAFVYLSVRDLESGKYVNRDGEEVDAPDFVPTELESPGEPETRWGFLLPTGDPENSTQNNPGPPSTFQMGILIVDRVGNAAIEVGPTFVVGDTTPPSQPVVETKVISNHEIDIFWTPSTDVSGIREYQVRRNGELVQSDFSLAFNDTGLDPDTTYEYVVTAVDNNGNEADSDVARATTLPATAPPAPNVSEWKFSPSGLDGAGMQNTIAVNPNKPNEILIGGDVAGIHRSENRGAGLFPSTEGMWLGPQLHVASILYHPTVPDKVYAGSGIQGNNGGFFRSTDGGRTWELRSGVPKFGGDNNNGGKSPVPTPHPRSTGKLIEVTPNGNLYAATYKNGLMRSKDDGKTWTTLAFNNKFLRGITLDPANPDILYVAVYNDGVYAVTNLNGSVNTKKLAGGLQTPEEVAVVDGVLYVPGGRAGVYKSTGSGTNRTLNKIGAIPTDGSVAYMSVAGVKPAGEPATIYTGCWKCTKGSNGTANNVYRSTDGGNSWQSITADPSKISYVPRGSDRNWWLLDANASMALGKGSYIAAQIVIDPTNPDNVYMAGRSGAWASDDGGDTWRPIVRGLGATIPRDADASPDGQNVYVALADWVLVYSTDAGRNFQQSKPPHSNVGFSVSVDPRTGSVYTGVGERDRNEDGEVWRNDNVAGNGNWVSENLAPKTGGKRVLGVGVGYEGNQRVLLAGVEGSGLWRKQGTGQWQRVGGDLLTESGGSRKIPRGAAVSRNNDLDVIYVYDPVKGVYRSTDYGRTWQKIWAHPATQQFESFLAVDPANDDRLYVNDGKKLWRLEGAKTGTVGTGITTTDLKVASPGPVAVGGSRDVFVVDQVQQGKPAALLRSSDAGATWTEFPDEVISGLVAPITGQGLFINENDPIDSKLYLPLDGMGMVVGSDVDGEPTLPPPGEQPPGEQPPSESDNEQPSTTIEVPAQDATLTPTPQGVAISGSATDNSSVAAVRVAIQRVSDKKWLQPNGSFGSYTLLDTSLTSAGSEATDWATTRSLAEGSYGMHAIAEDGAGNKDDTKTWHRFTVAGAAEEPPPPADETPPTVQVTAPDGEVSTGDGQVTISGTAEDDTAVATVTLAIQRGSDDAWLRDGGTFGARQELSTTLADGGAASTTWTRGVTLPAGQYTAIATGTDEAGNSAAGDPQPFTVVVPDTTAPETTTAVPQNEVELTATGGSVTLSGGATDDTGVAKVYVAVKRSTDNQWLQADGTVGGERTLLPATVANEGAKDTGWTIDVPLANGSYGMHALAEDTSGNRDASLEWRKFTVVGDVSAPLSMTDMPFDKQDFPAGSPVNMSGVAGDDTSVAEVLVAIQRLSDKKWLQENGSWGDFLRQPATLADPGATMTEWTFEVDLPAGEYGVQVVAKDAVDQLEEQPNWSRFNVVPDNAVPTSTTDAPTKNQALPAGKKIVVAGSAGDDVNLRTVLVSVQRMSDKKWLQENGTWGAFVRMPSELTNPGSTASDWRFEVNLPKGGYGVQINAEDAAGKRQNSPTWVPFTVG